MQMEKVKISIIVPAYNAEAYLEKCLDSILAQTHQNIEVIAVDDGSTDGTGSIIDSYANKDSRVVALHQVNSGVTKARFAGLRRASGEWFGFVDGDDFIESDMYERLLKNALEYHADISHCGYRMIFPNCVYFYHNTGYLAEQDKLTGLKDLLDGSRIEPGLCNKLFHKTLFHSLLHSGIEESGIKINEDLLMNFYLFRAAEKSVYEDFCPYHYLIHSGSATTTKQRHHYLDPIRVRKQIYEAIRENSELSRIVYSRYIYMLIHASVQTKFVDVSEMCHAELKQNCKQDFRLDSTKLKLMAITVAYFRSGYRMVRKVYEMIKGLDHRRDVY